MTVTGTGIYDSSDKIRNAANDLNAPANPREDDFVGEEAILGRPNPTRLN